MKTTKNVPRALFLITFLLILSSFNNKAVCQSKEYEEVYFYIYISGTWTENKTSYVSEPIYYTGYEECNDMPGYEFQNKAKAAFAVYLKANYYSVFKYASTNNMQIIQYANNSTSRYLKTRQEASDRLNALKAEELDKDYEVAMTLFNYSCE